jgi:hypothetical protein
MAKKKRGTVLWVEIELEGDGFPTAEELGARNAIMELVEEREIGRLGGSGGGLGAMDFEVAVASTDVRSARGKISRLIRRVLPKRRFTIRQMKDD